MHCGLLGRKLGHSHSPAIHALLGDYDYALFEVEPDELEQFFKKKQFDCINVTIPYKKAVINFCSKLSDTAKRLGSVNTIIRNHDGNWIGHNTDYFGFQYMLNKSGIPVQNKKVLVLGSGGASQTVCAVLKELQANTVIISRSGADNYSNISLHKDASLIVNTTPVGMYPNNCKSPVDLSVFPKLEGVLDLIYNPANTALLMQAKARGLIAANGLWMLIAQAKESAEWFTGKAIDDAVIDKIYSSISKATRNIILIGMPGSGKSTIGKLIAAASGKEFLDSDSEIEKQAGLSCSAIICKYGEARFRAMETSVLEQLGKRTGVVIATGGGCVTRDHNLPLLQQNGTIYWLQRDISLLSTDGRPLSQAHSLDRMYQIRKPMYEKFADFSVENQDDVQQVVEIILNQEALI